MKMRLFNVVVFWLLATSLWAGSNRVKFVKDAQGRVTHFVSTFVEGDLVVKRIPDGK